MMVFFRNIHKDTVRSEIIDFITPAIKGGFFKAKGEIKSVRILGLREKNFNSFEYHALAAIEPDTVALRAIRKLHGQLFKGKRIAVRQYYIRNTRNDKRAVPTSTDWELKDKRKLATRRRDLEIIEEMMPQYTGLENFRRRY